MFFMEWKMELWYNIGSCKSEFVKASESNTTIQDTMEEYKNVER